MHWSGMKNETTEIWEASELIAFATPGQILAWSRELGCSTIELQAAVGAVGHNTVRVREHLRSRKKQSLKDRGSQGIYALVLGALALVAVVLMRQMTAA